MTKKKNGMIKDQMQKIQIMNLIRMQMIKDQTKRTQTIAHTIVQEKNNFFSQVGDLESR